MNSSEKNPNRTMYDGWNGENVKITISEGDLFGNIKASRNGALILMPLTGRRNPKFINYSEIVRIQALNLPQKSMPEVTLQTVRQHMFEYHAFNAPWTSPEDLMKVHASQHRNDAKLEEKNLGHVHPR